MPGRMAAGESLRLARERAANALGAAGRRLWRCKDLSNSDEVIVDLIVEALARVGQSLRPKQDRDLDSAPEHIGALLHRLQGLASRSHIVEEVRASGHHEPDVKDALDEGLDKGVGKSSSPPCDLFVATTHLGQSAAESEVDMEKEGEGIRFRPWRWPRPATTKPLAIFARSRKGTQQLGDIDIDGNAEIRAADERLLWPGADDPEEQTGAKERLLWPGARTPKSRFGDMDPDDKEQEAICDERLKWRHEKLQEAEDEGATDRRSPLACDGGCQNKLKRCISCGNGNAEYKCDDCDKQLTTIWDRLLYCEQCD